jgi:hypothetical protein
MDKREQVYKGVSKWISTKVDELVGDNIWLALASNTIKRTTSELIEGVLPMDMLIPILSNRGVIDAQIVADELIEALNNVPDYTQEFKGGIAVHLTKGVIKVELPSSGIISSLLKGNNVFKFTEDDIRELAKFINESKE